MPTANDPTLTSVLGPIICDLICEKRGLGYHYNKEVRDFARFDRFCVAIGHHDLALPRELVDAWTTKQAYETEINRHFRISLLRVLGRYMQQCSYPAWVYPPQATSRSTSTYVPYIFSKAEVAALLTAADACQPDSNSPYRNLVLPVLFRVLYGTGLRIAEALALQRSDLDLCNGTLHIRQAKLDKERCIPIHPVLLEQMELYLGKLELIFGPEGPLFPGPTGVAYTADTIYRYFRRFLWQARIPHRGRGQGPRVHDLRHVFAVHCLKKWVLDGVDLTVALPYLSAYMGHVGLKSTQGYLRLTADLYPTIVMPVERHFGSIIPEGGGHQ